MSPVRNEQSTEQPQPELPVNQQDMQHESLATLRSSGESLKTDEGKKMFDQMKLPCFNPPKTVLDPSVKETLDRKWFYLVNYKDIKCDLLGQADCPAFPDSLWHDIIVGNFVDLDKVFSRQYSLEADSEFTQSIGDIDLHIRGSGNANKPVKEV
ncbi:hypothetical protein M422DRAFT_243547 [Sphaerobolus stellatus SS14]|nr:hypothetical protein M422DRAFT_243547 [Sphaerobolus stellatus SS14]